MMELFPFKSSIKPTTAYVNIFRFTRKQLPYSGNQKQMDEVTASLEYDLKLFTSKTYYGINGKFVFIMNRFILFTYCVLTF